MFDQLKAFIGTVEEFDGLKGSEKIDFLAYYLTVQNKMDYFQAKDISGCFTHLKAVPYSNIPQYLNDNSNTARPKRKKIKFLKSKNGFHLEGNFEKELKSKIKEVQVPFINYTVNSDSYDWKPSDIPFLNSKTRKSAEFFSKLYYLLYHLENSIRKFLQQRLISILGNNWEAHILASVDLTKAQSIRKEVSLSEMLPERGDNILYYCMWDDYGKIIQCEPRIFSKPKEVDEVVAHLNSLSKIRNAIAHNTLTIPKDYQDELTLFLKKYIKIVTQYEK